MKQWNWQGGIKYKSNSMQPYWPQAKASKQDQMGRAIQDDALLPEDERWPFEVSETDGATITIDMSASFQQKAVRHTEQLGEINVATKQLQKKKLMLKDCCFIIDELREHVWEGRNDPELMMLFWLKKYKWIK